MSSQKFTVSRPKLLFALFLVKFTGRYQLLTKWVHNSWILPRKITNLSQYFVSISQITLRRFTSVSVVFISPSSAASFWRFNSPSSRISDDLSLLIWSSSLRRSPSLAVRDRSRLATFYFVSWYRKRRKHTFSPSAFFSRSHRRIVSSCNISAVCAEARRPSEPRLPSSRAPSDLFRAFKLVKINHLDNLQASPVVCSIPLLFALGQLFWQLRTFRSCQVALLFSFFELYNELTEWCTDNLILVLIEVISFYLWKWISNTKFLHFKESVGKKLQ